MKRYDPTQNLFSVEPCNPADMFKFKMQVERVSCFHCGQVTAIPVRTEYIDWQSVAETYRKQLNRVLNDHSTIMAEMELIYWCDNPAAVHYRNKWAMLALEIRAHFGGSGQFWFCHWKSGFRSYVRVLPVHLHRYAPRFALTQKKKGRRLLPDPRCFLGLWSSSQNLRRQSEVLYFYRATFPDRKPSRVAPMPTLADRLAGHRRAWGIWTAGNKLLTVNFARCLL